MPLFDVGRFPHLDGLRMKVVCGLYSISKIRVFFLLRWYDKAIIYQIRSMLRGQAMLKKLMIMIFFVAILGNLPFRAEAKAADSQDMIYYIDVDRYIDGRNENNQETDQFSTTDMHGGDLVGTYQKLDVVHSMGFTTICLSPILDASGRLYQHFGTEQDLKQLVSKIHEMKMKVLIAYDSKAVINVVQVKQFALAHQIDGTLDVSLIETPQSAVMRTVFSKPDTKISILKDKQYQSGNLIAIDDPASERFTHTIVEAEQYPGTRWKLALTYLYTTPQIPIVYYGSEASLNGGAPPNNRPMMSMVDRDLADLLTQLASIRKTYPVLVKGDIKFLKSQNGVLVYERSYEGKQAVIVINNRTKTSTIQLDKNQFGIDKELRGMLHGYRVQNGTDGYQITLDPETAEIYIVGDKTGFNYAIAVAPIVAFMVFGNLFIFMKKRKSSNES